MSHIRIDLSSEPETMRIPSVENATEVTESVWPFSTLSSLPVDVSHTRTDLSLEPETMRVPSVEKATELTDEVWPFRTLSSLPVDASTPAPNHLMSQRRCVYHQSRMRPS